MTSKCLARVLILALSFVLCMPAHAQAPNILGPPPPGSPPIGGVTKGEVIGIIVGAVAVVVVVTIVIVHYSKKRSITGCVSSGPNGMTVTDENDKRIYALSGDTAGVKPGERMRLQGSKITSNGGKPLGWDTRKINKDFGVCQP